MLKKHEKKKKESVIIFEQFKSLMLNDTVQQAKNHKFKV